MANSLTHLDRRPIYTGPNALAPLSCEAREPPAAACQQLHGNRRVHRCPDRDVEGERGVARDVQRPQRDLR